MEIYESPSFCSSEVFKGIAHLSFRQLVDGSTKQIVTFRGLDYVQGQSIRGRIFLRIRFEEILFVTLQLHNWQGMRIPKEDIVDHCDISANPFRHIVFRIGDNPPSKAVVSKNPQFPRWKGPIVVSYTGTDVGFRNSVIVAVVYASSTEDKPEIPIGYSAMPLLSITEVPFVRAPLG